MGLEAYMKEQQWAYKNAGRDMMFVLSCVQVAALRQADPLSKEPYCLCKHQETEKVAVAQQRAVDG
jgi:hypothetical protein